MHITIVYQQAKVKLLKIFDPWTQNDLSIIKWHTILFERKKIVNVTVAQIVIVVLKKFYVKNYKNYYIIK